MFQESTRDVVGKQTVPENYLERAKKALAECQSPPQELEVGLRSYNIYIYFFTYMKKKDQNS